MINIFKLTKKLMEPFILPRVICLLISEIEKNY